MPRPKTSPAEDGWSLTRPDGSPKEAYATFQAEAWDCDLPPFDS